MKDLNCSTSEETKVIFKKNRIICDNKPNILDKYMNIETEINNLIDQKTNIAIHYYNILDEVIYNKSYEHKHLLNKFTDEINEVELKINNLKEIYNKLNINQELLNLENENQLLELKEKELKDKNDKNDILLAKKLSEIHIKKYELFKQIKELKNIYLKNIIPIETNKIEEIKEDIKEKPIKNKNVNIKLLNNEKKEKLNSKIKEKLFKFKNIDECTSKKRSMTYYMSRQDVINLIDKEDKIKNLMPANYKTLTKEDLCKYIDKI